MLQAKTGHVFRELDWDEIGGLKSQLERIRSKIELPLEHAELYKEFNISLTKGILLYGPPGTGKTLIARAIASRLIKEGIDNPKYEEKRDERGYKQQVRKDPSSFFYFKGAELNSKYVGDTEKNITGLFQQARTSYMSTGNRSVIFIDEADGFLHKGGTGDDIANKHHLATVATFLAEMDGFNSSYNPLIILATNKEKEIDPAVLRPGRIDLHIYVGRPNQQDSEEIFQIYLRKTLCKDVEGIAKEATQYLFSKPGYDKVVSGAFINNTLRTAAEYAIRRYLNTNRDKFITIIDIMYAIDMLMEKPEGDDIFARLESMIS